MKAILYPSLMQLLIHAPAVLVYLVGGVLALICWRRCPLRSILSLSGCAFLLVLTVVQPFINNYILHARAEFGWSAQRIGHEFAIVGVAMSFAFAVGLALLVAAAFVRGQSQRQAPQQSI